MGWQPLRVFAEVGGHHFYRCNECGTTAYDPAYIDETSAGFWPR
jgi:hypothetical protein